jgi:hypothetical protein
MNSRLCSGRRKVCAHCHGSRCPNPFLGQVCVLVTSVLSSFFRRILPFLIFFAPLSPSLQNMLLWKNNVKNKACYVFRYLNGFLEARFNLNRAQSSMAARFNLNRAQSSMAARFNSNRAQSSMAARNCVLNNTDHIDFQENRINRDFQRIVRRQVLTSASMKMTAIWDIAP